MHLARLLDLPYVLAEVTVSSLPRSVDLVGRVSADPTRPGPDGITDAELCTRLGLWHGLLRHGLIDGEIHGDTLAWTVLDLDRVPAPWWPGSAELATTANTVYERAYPGALADAGVPDGVGGDPAAWQHWLLHG